VAPEGFLADCGLPVFRTLRIISGYRLYHPRKLAKRLESTGRSPPIAAERVSAMAATLAERFPPA
jgi:hypothetical protein